MSTQTHMTVLRRSAVLAAILALQTAAAVCAAAPVAVLAPAVSSGGGNRFFARSYRMARRQAPAAGHASPAQPHVLPSQHHAAPAHPAYPSDSEAPAIHTEDDGFIVTGRDFSLHVDRSGALSDIARHGQMVFTRAALEVRGKTWHIKLAPRPDQVQVSAPRTDARGAHFHYAIRMDDANSGIRLDLQESLTVRSAGILDLTLNLIPRAQFESQRIAWTIQFPADRFVGTMYVLASDNGERTTGPFPEQRAPDPHMARRFSWLRLDDGLGPIDINFLTTDRHSQPLPDENMLEDLRWWNVDRFWVEAAAPYGPVDRPVDTPLVIQPDDSRTLRITVDLHAAAAR